MNNRNKILGIVVLVIVVLVGIFVFMERKSVTTSDYSVVYLSTGEVYVGRLSTFPDLELTDAYVFQATKDTVDPKKNTFQLTPIKDALWATKSMHLVKDNVVFYGALNLDSQIAKTLMEQKK